MTATTATTATTSAAAVADRYAAAAEQLARQLGRDRDGRWRCEAVTIAALLTFSRQLTAAGRPALLEPSASDERIAAATALLTAELTARAPWLVPPTVRLAPQQVRALIAPFDGVELGRDHGAVDALDIAFGNAAPMHGKQQTSSAFFTPPSVVELLTAATLEASSAPPWTERLHEPAVGTGAFLVAAWHRVEAALHTAVETGQLTLDDSRHLVRRWASGVSAVDLDPEAAWCAALQLVVRCGHSGAVYVGDALEPSTWRPALHPYEPVPTADQIAELDAEFSALWFVARMCAITSPTRGRRPDTAGAAAHPGGDR